MKKISLFLLASCLFTIPTFAFAEGVNDLFTGTLAIYRGDPVLIRCDLVQNTYILIDENGQTTPYIDQIKALNGRIEKPVSATVYGSYKEIAGKNHLIVSSIEQIKKNNTCHLLPPKEPLNVVR